MNALVAIAGAFCSGAALIANPVDYAAAARGTFASNTGHTLTPHLRL